MDKCKRCGKCCLAAPCMVIKIGKEVYEYVDGIKIHRCKFFSMVDGIAVCRVYGLHHRNGMCTNSKII